MSVFSRLFNPLLNRKQRRLMLDTIKITGIVRIIQGGKVVVEARNHFVNQGLLNLINHLSWSTGTESTLGAYWGVSPFANSFIVLGTNTTTPTDKTHTALQSPIGAAPGTKANSQSMSVANPSAGVYQVLYLSTWNAGTVSGTIGEVGLYLLGWSTLQTPNTDFPGPGNLMCSRLSVADGDFTAYTINTALPLTVQWIVQFSFA